jgi:hypothetical protein
MVEDIHISVALHFCSYAVTKRSLNKADHCRCLSNGRKRIKLEAEAISEILFAVTHSETGAEGSKNVLPQMWGGNVHGALFWVISH